MPLYTYNGVLLRDGNALAISPNCCCDECDVVTVSGGAGTTINTYTFRPRPGLVTFSWEAYFVPDRFVVETGGNVVVDTGVVQGGGEATFCKPEGATEIKVTVTGPGGTAWVYTLGCLAEPC